MDIRGFGDLLGEEAFLYPVKRSTERNVYLGLEQLQLALIHLIATAAVLWFSLWCLLDSSRRLHVCRRGETFETGNSNYKQQITNTD